ncbi:MAG: glycosyltransferase family 2 protein [Pedobacter sp.]|nr:MAG: glycosyltransferase family 2 protein [Pedobacter sp.]
MQNKKYVHIIMSTYNGGNYLNIQLDSLIAQTHTNWRLTIRDDGSTDDSVMIIKEYVSLDRRIEIFTDGLGNLKSCQSFSKLMENVPEDANYIMFCDQDDIWHEDKIEKTLCTMIENEGVDQHMPILVYGTYDLVDENGRLIGINSPNYSQYPKLSLLLGQTYIYGCTMMINKTLLKHALPIPLTAENHDYWVSLVCSINDGRFYYLEDPLIQYRQHSMNVSGSYKDSSYASRFKRFFNGKESLKLTKRIEMFKSLDNQFKHINNTHSRMLKGFLVNLKKGNFYALNYCIKNKIRRRGTLQTLSFYFNILKLVEQ